MSGEQDPQAGRLLAGRYRLTAVLGQGGMGTVWRAEDEFLGRDVAVKELRFASDVDDEERRRLVSRTLTEAKAIARIRHNGAVTVYDVVEEDGRPWIVMELVESRSLSEVIQADGVLPPQRAAEVALELLGVLAEAHRVGILHRDVKPSNVLMGFDGRVVLTDFGIARVEGDPSVTSTGMLVGAPSYISPERARGGVPGPPADMWSLGATIFAMVEGTPPYDKGSALSTLTAVMTDPVPPLRHGELLEPVIAGLLRKDPRQRLDASTAQAMLRGVVGEYERRARATTNFAAVAPDAPTQVVPEPERTRVQPSVTSGLGSGLASGLASGKAAGSEAVGAPGPDPASATTQLSGGGPAAPRSTGWAGRQRALLIGGIVLAAVLLVTAAVASMRNNSGGSGSGSGSGVGAGATSTAAPGSSGDSAPQTPTAGDSGSGDGTGTGTARPTAAGYHQVAGPGGSHLQIPDGWRLVSESASSVKFSGPAGTLQVDFSAHPQSDGALAAWKKEESSVAADLTDYHLIRLDQVSYRGWDAADWEWGYQSGSTMRQSLNRGFVVDAHHAYALYWTAPLTSWTDGRSGQLLARFFDTFQPGG
ncbi:tRNA A-37 threonylcarbamoyl transferase component Bud32 [Streptacidiphilus sp. BW17]|uniref:serine/threonine-protein kinase n=1 Tax=Streptacidiphilus sp. BW17 TaxID=3156274 RepID=UPI003510E5FB